MTVWEPAAPARLAFPAADAARTAHLRDADCNDQMGALGVALEAAFTALAPHLAARDAAVRREALEEAARCVEGLCDPGTPASSVTTVRKHAANIIRALATDATP